MSESKHTPGPWVCPGMLGYGLLVQGPGPIFRQIAVVYGPSVTPEAQPNARLIAAAPELYEALKGVEWADETDLAEGGTAHCCPWCGREQQDGAHWDDCKLAAALAKAEGRP